MGHHLMCACLTEPTQPLLQARQLLPVHTGNTRVAYSTVPIRTNAGEPPTSPPTVQPTTHGTGMHTSLSEWELIKFIATQDHREDKNQEQNWKKQSFQSGSIYTKFQHTCKAVGSLGFTCLEGGKMEPKKMIRQVSGSTPGKSLPHTLPNPGSAVGYNEGTIFGLLHLVQRL